MQTNSVTVGWSEEALPLGTHVCFYYSDEPSQRMTLDFLRIGLDAPREFCVIFADESRQQELSGWLQEGYEGSVSELIERGKLALIGGAPTLDGLITKIGSRLQQAVAEGHTVIRFLGFIAWGEPGWPDEVTLLEFEARVNQVVTDFPAVIVCTYGVPRLEGSQLIYGGLQTHPVVVLNRKLVTDNPFYIDPQVEG